MHEPEPEPQRAAVEQPPGSRGGHEAAAPRTPHGPLLLPPDGAAPLQLRAHAAYLMAVIRKGVPEAYDSNRLTMLHFAVAGLDLLGQRELLDPYRYAERLADVS